MLFFADNTDQTDLKNTVYMYIWLNIILSGCCMHFFFFHIRFLTHSSQSGLFYYNDDGYFSLKTLEDVYTFCYVYIVYVNKLQLSWMYVYDPQGIFVPVKFNFEVLMYWGLSLFYPARHKNRIFIVSLWLSYRTSNWTWRNRIFWMEKENQLALYTTHTEFPIAVGFF